MLKQITKYKTALYCRLSKDDEGVSESASITTQKKMLEVYAKENGFDNFYFYIDDGFSGTNFERPAFKRMIADVEIGKINLIITKDLSRLGRDYIVTGQYTEIYFPSKGVRYIAINDGYDSDNLNNDIAPFKNIINEMYARDISKKIRSAFNTKMKSGDFIGAFAPYGYKKSHNNKNKLVIDEDVAPIVKKIFKMSRDGNRPSAIANYLNDNDILTPSEYRCGRLPYLKIENYSKRREWTSQTIYKMLNNQVYLGNLAQGKTNKISFKSHKTINRDKSDWIVSENTHEAIIDIETFEIIRKHTISRTNKSSNKFENIFSGIAKCSDCGKNMSTTGTRCKTRRANLTCGAYKLYGKSACTNHFIDYDDLYDKVLFEIKKIIVLLDEDKKEIINFAENKINEKLNLNNKNEYKNALYLEKRNKELDDIMQKLYEDNLSNKISDSRFSKLLGSYEKEQKEIENKIIKINQNTAQRKEKSKILKKYFDIIEEYSNIVELNSELLYEFIDRIEISQGSYLKEGQTTTKNQEIKIFYKFADEILY